ncbi:MAG: 50S ribosomal protein L18a [Methanomicrobiaceae archaeon]|nr:MAG: ribosomal LX protein [Methanoculleus sp. SDB]MBN1194953.1 50S ribosomal protein L18a [Methanomicrobiaceae archaeon]
MAEQNYEVKGEFKVGDEWKPYSKVVTVPNEMLAKERIYTIIGSKHRLKRNYIKINAVLLVDGE